jgi:peptide chain release factor 2
MELKDLEALKKEILLTITDLNIKEKSSQIGDLESKTLNEDFWKNKDSAETILKEISILKKEITTAKSLKKDINNIIDLWNSSTDADRQELEQFYEKIQKEFNQFQEYQYLSERHDKSDCILSIYAGQGGTDANDWAEMLFRMYKMYCDKKGWRYDILHITKGNEAGLSSVTMKISGDFAYGLLKNETGTHRLVRLSPFNAKNLRQTSFAGVEVIPVINNTDEITINPKDIEFKAVRASGPGGQFVNKTSSAVQIKHIPTGITVHCS